MKKGLKIFFTILILIIVTYIIDLLLVLSFNFKPIYSNKIKSNDNYL